MLRLVPLRHPPVLNFCPCSGSLPWDLRQPDVCLATGFVESPNLSNENIDSCQKAAVYYEKAGIFLPAVQRERCRGVLHGHVMFIKLSERVV